MIDAAKKLEWVVRLQDGDNVMDALRGLDVDSALILVGVGMLREIEIGYWDGTKYLTHTLTMPHELVSLQGNLALDEDGERIAHAHVGLAAPDGAMCGGHLVRAVAHNTVEVALQPLQDVTLQRRKEESGLVGLYPETR